MHIVSIGEILWDIIGPTEYLGGAPLNFAAHARKLGHELFMVSGVGDDQRGQRALQELARCGISPQFVQVRPGKKQAQPRSNWNPTAGLCFTSCDRQPTIPSISRPRT